jgi:hypothetical protein
MGEHDLVSEGVRGSGGCDVGSLVAARNAAEAGIVGVVADADLSGSWQGAGVVSLIHWVCWQLGAARGRAARYVAMAKRRHELPVTFKLFAEGALGVDQVAAICRHCPPDFATTSGSRRSLRTLLVRRRR